TKIITFVGSREADLDAVDFTKKLAKKCAENGAIVVSGGAIGIDRASHEGALDAGGRTWAVMGCGSDFTSPAKNADLFDRIRDSGRGAFIWPFEHDRRPGPQNFLARNRILIGLADVVVVGQASLISGSRSSASIARKTGKPLWVVPGPPWMSNFGGSLLEIELGARILKSETHFLTTVFGPNAVANPGKKQPIVNRSPEEMALLEAATERPEHLDELCDLAGLSPCSAATALLTLALEHVLVEGPPGYYRRG
ncbi:MAG: DNA-processing protein DprA, partial [Polyangiaceae bacterium]